MTFDQCLQLITSPKIRKILYDEARTTYQRAADLHAMLSEVEILDAPTPKPRKAREIKPKPDLENRDARPTQGDGEIG